MVLSRNEDETADAETRYSRVTQLFVRHTDLLYHLTFADGTRLETTWNHPFWVEGSGWVETKDLKTGYLTVLSSGERLEIQSVKESPQEQEVTVYNFEVQNDHTYFVADKETTSDEASFIWVHNQVAEGYIAAELTLVGLTLTAGACHYYDPCNDLVQDTIGIDPAKVEEGAIGLLNLMHETMNDAVDYVFGAEDVVRPEHPVPNVPDNASESPGEDWEWKGKPGSKPGDKDGSWTRPDPKETLHPDLDHPDPIGPHWDWKDPSGNWWRINPDGSVVPK